MITSIPIRSLRDSFRDHPGMYFGHRLDKAGLHHLTDLVLTAFVDPQTQNKPTRVEIIVADSTSIVIKDNGRGLPLGPFKYGQSDLVVETLYSSILFNHPSQLVYREFGFLVLLGPLLNAASQKLIIETHQAGNLYQLNCAKGEVIKGFQLIDNSNGVGTQLNFKPDPELFAEAKIDSELVKRSLFDLRVAFPKVEFVFKEVL